MTDAIPIGSLWHIDSRQSGATVRVEREERPGWCVVSYTETNEALRLTGASVGDTFEVELEWFRRRGLRCA